MFLTYYGLNEQPFGVTPDPRFLYFGEVHREALASLVYGIEAGLGFASLIAEPGTGKTTLLYYLLTRYRASARTAFIFESQCTSHELLRNLALEFGIGDPGGDRLGTLNCLKEFLAQQARARRRVILVLDEAQNFDDTVLETVRLLSNFETAGSKLLHIILSGQPQLAEKLSRPQLLNVRQRISIAGRLRPFPPMDVVKYVAHRLSVAGYRGPELFTPAALESIARLSGGVPREINRLCFGAMSLGFALQRRLIDADMLREVANDFDFSALLRAEPARYDLAIPSSEELGREFAEALARAQESAAAEQRAKAQSAATAAPSAAPVVAATPPPATAATPQARPERRGIQAPISKPATNSAVAKSRSGRPLAAPVQYPPSDVMPLQSWIARDASRNSRLKSALIAGVLALLALAAMGTQLLPTAPAAQPAAAAASLTSAQTATSQTAGARPVAAQSQPQRRAKRATNPSSRGIE